jgi:phosphoribosylformimino-5-aminoimidazole carboxamide ribotide isomerase
LRIIPVIDVLGGVAVHAVRGRRREYKPLKSVLTDSTQPLNVAQALKAGGFSELYVADLDAIMRKGSNLDEITQITQETGLKVMVDSGTSNLTHAQTLLRHNITKVIIGTETLTDLSFVKKAIECLGTEKIVVSLDMKAGRVLSKFDAARSLNPVKLAKEFVDIGVKELIMLDLARVGSGEGVDVSLLKEIVDSRNVKVLVGGGIRGIEELEVLKNVRVDGVLLATCLHSGRVSPQDLKPLIQV